MENCPEPEPGAAELELILPAGVEDLDAAIARVRHIKQVAVERKARRSDKLPVTGERFAELAEVDAAAGEFLDAAIVLVHDEDIPAAVYRHAAGELNCPLPLPALPN